MASVRNSKKTILNPLINLNYCNQGGLVTACHNKIHDRVADMAVKYFTPNLVRDDLFIFAGSAVKRPKENTTRYKSKKSTEPTITKGHITEG